MTTPPLPHTRAAPSGRPRPVRLGSASLAWRPRTVLVALATLAALLLLLVRAVTAADDYPIGAAEALGVLFGGGSGGGRFVVWQLRLPRALAAVLVGLALGAAGAVTQSISRNPLASPDTLGVTWGAAAGAVFVIIFGGGYGGISGQVVTVGVPAGALTGGLIAGLAVYLLAWRGGLAGHRLLLVGVGASVILANLTYWFLTFTEVLEAGRAQQWLTGSLHAADWGRVVPTAACLAVLLPLTLAGARPLAALGLGDEAATGLGVGVERVRAGLLLCAVLLAAVATAAAGPVAFVALASPQIALRLCRASHPPVGVSALLAAAVLLAADQLASSLFDPVQLPVGVFTAVLGAPYLMYLLVRGQRHARL